MKTTLNKIREYKPCIESWTQLLKYLGKTKPDDEPLALLTILDSSGFDFALWCTILVDGYEKELRLFGVWCAGQVQHLMPNRESINALAISERYSHGLATEEELKVACVAAYVDYVDYDASVYYAAYAARAAASADRDGVAAHAASAAASAAAYAAAENIENGDDSISYCHEYSDSNTAAAAAYTKERQKQESKFREMLEEIKT